MFLALFVVFAGLVWIDLLSDIKGYDHVIGSEPACSISRDYCSWASYVRAQLIPSLLGLAAAVALAWRRLPRREAILNIPAILAFAYLVWSVVRIRLES